MGEKNLILTIIVFLPTVGALALLLLRRDDHEWIRRLAFATAVAEFGISLLLLRGFDAATPGYQFVELRAWIEQPAIAYHLGMDGLSLWLVLLATLLTPMAMLASWNSIQSNVREFFIMLLVLETGMVGVFLALDLFLFFVFWEVMLVPMYFLIGVWGHERRIYAAVKFVLYTMAGSVLMLVAILWLYNLTGTFNLVEIQAVLQSGALQVPFTSERWLFLAFFVAFAIKVPLFPAHTWLPDAHVEAPTAGSVILAGVLLKMGTYGMLRFCLPLFPAASREFAPYIGALAVVGIIYGALVAMVQPDFKKLVAYSSVSHLGMVVLGIFAFNQLGMQGAIYQMLNHGVSTGGLFLVAGMLYDRRHTHLIAEFGGLATPMPRLSALFLFVCLSSIGLPLLNGFVGEFLILNGTWLANGWWAGAAASAVILSAVYLLWAYQRLMFGEITVEKNRALPDLSLRERSLLVATAVLILVMGVASPIFTRRTETAARTVLEQMERRFSEVAKTPAPPAAGPTATARQVLAPAPQAAREVR
jgi:NADH-quinone oxidoreductase subunit M